MKILVVFCLVFLTFGLQSNIAVNTWFKGYHFDARVRIHKHGNANEFLRGSKRYISVHEGDVYSILIKNPLPVRVAVAVSVDGLNIIDALIGDTLISVLRQLRSGYDKRPKVFPISIILCGIRDIKDYRIHRSNNDIITGGSAFNIKAESLRLGNFSKENTKNLLLEHTKR